MVVTGREGIVQTVEGGFRTFPGTEYLRFAVKSIGRFFQEAVFAAGKDQRDEKKD